MWILWLIAFSHLAAADGNGASRFSRVKFLYMHGVYDSAEPALRSRFSRAAVLPSGSRDTVGTLDSLFRSSSTSGIPPAYAPVQRFQCSLTAALTWLGVRAVRYSFLCMTLSFTTSRRFIPTLSTQECVRHKLRQACRRIEGVCQIRSERPDILHFLGGRRPLRAFADKERMLAAPDHRCETAFRHQTRRADITKTLFAARYKRHEAIALQDEMGSNLSRDNLNPRGGQPLQLFQQVSRHIL